MTEVKIDDLNKWMRSTPWYQQQVRAFGQDPARPNLTKDQRSKILRLAQANGVQVDEGNNEIDAGGNFDTKGKKLRNTLIVAGIVGASIATLGAAGAFAGGAAAAGAGGGAAAGGGVAAVGAGAGALTTGAGISSWLAPVLSVGVPVAGNVIGGVMQNRANRDATAISDQYLRDALDYEKEQDAYTRKRNEEQTAYDRSRVDADQARADEKLGYERNQYGDYLGRLQPFIGAGASSNDRQAQLLGLPAPARSAPQSRYFGPPSTGLDRQPPPNQPPAQPTSQAQPAAPPQAMPQMVLMQAPDGSQKEVPEDQVEHWTARGARRVA